MINFELHPNLAHKIFIIDLPLSKVLLENEKNYPWLLLVPRRPNVTRLMDLILEDQLTLMKEMHIAQEILWDKFKPTQLNVATIGIKTPQLHIHVIGRFKNDPAWPGTVWDHPIRNCYSQEQSFILTNQLRDEFELQLIKI